MRIQLVTKHTISGIQILDAIRNLTRMTREDIRKGRPIPGLIPGNLLKPEGIHAMILKRAYLGNQRRA